MPSLTATTFRSSCPSRPGGTSSGTAEGGTRHTHVRARHHARCSNLLLVHSVLEAQPVPPLLLLIIPNTVVTTLILLLLPLQARFRLEPPASPSWPVPSQGGGRRQDTALTRPLIAGKRVRPAGRTDSPPPPLPARSPCEPMMQNGTLHHGVRPLRLSTRNIRRQNRAERRPYSAARSGSLEVNPKPTSLPWPPSPPIPRFYSLLLPHTPVTD